MKLLIIPLFFLVNLWGYSQGINNLWVLGYDNPDTTQWGGMTIDFASGNPTIFTDNRLLNFRETNGVISDQAGNLLFASNGIFIENAAHDTMVNGSGLNPGPWTNTRLDKGLTLPQGNLVIPVPNHNSQYYLFHETIDDYGHTYGALYLYYSIIDMSLQSGLGEVIQKNVVLLNDTLVAGWLTACKHANGRDWWITCHQVNTNVFHKFILTSYGILGPFSQAVGEVRASNLGQNQFSPDGNYFAYYEPQVGDLDIFNFDRCDGTLTLISHVDIVDTSIVGGVAFSPNSGVLYVSSNKYVFQFDLTASNISSSLDTVAIWDGYYSPGPPFATSFFLAQLAPDGKIYINCGNGTLDIHVIENPDILGDSCNVCQHCVHLPRYNAFTIPNYPNYFLGSESGTICDSLVTIDDASAYINLFSVVNNNSELVFTFKASSKNRTLTLVDVSGKLILNQTIPQWSTIQRISLSDCSTGIYFARLESEVIKLFLH